MIINDEISKKYGAEVAAIVALFESNETGLPLNLFNEDIGLYEDILEESIHEKAHVEGIEIFNGASKLCITLVDSEYVIKVPFNFYGMEDDYNYEQEAGYEKTDPYCHPFDTNYCDNELEIFEDAVDNEVDIAFAELVPYAVLSDHPVYIQKKIEITEEDYTYPDGRKSLDKFRVEDKDSITKAKSIKDSTDRSPVRELSVNWMARVIEFYGFEFLKKLINFIEDFGISDLHLGNYGYAADGAPVIFDYGGFYE